MSNTSCLNRRSLTDIFEKASANVASKLCQGQQLPPHDPISIMLKSVSGLAFTLSADNRAETDQLFIDKMCCDRVFEEAECVGVTPNAATRAKGCITITGNAGAIIPANIEFVGPDSTTYGLDVGNPAFLDASGQATVCLVAIEPGAASNISSGLFQTAQSYPDIDPDVTIDGDGIVGGADAETCEELRARLKERRRRVSQCGNEEWYIDQILAYPGVTNVCIASCECSSCGGCCKTGFLTFYPFFEGFPNDIPPQSLLDELSDYIYGPIVGAGGGVAPVAAQGAFEMAQALDVTLVIDCACDISPEELAAITVAADVWLKDNVCVGGPVCYSKLTAAISNAAPDLCPCGVRLEGTGIVNQGDCPDNGSIPCGFVPILTEVSICP